MFHARMSSFCVLGLGGCWEVALRFFFIKEVTSPVQIRKFEMDCGKATVWG